MANRYWVGGTGTWNGTNTTNWSDSSGGATGASVPTSADNVFFDANSNTGTGAFTVTMATVAAVCADFDASAVDGTMTLTGTVGIDVYGSLLWPATNFTRSYSGTTTFRATSTGKTINLNGKTFVSSITFDGVGGGWTFESAITTAANFTLTNGSIDLGGFTATGFNFSSNNSNTRTLAFNGGTYVITGSASASAQTLWNVATATNLTVTGTPTVNVINTSTNSGFTRTFTHGGTAGGSEPNAVNLNIQAGDVGSLVSVQGVYKNLNFTGCSSTLNNNARFICGNLIIGSGMTLTAGTNGITFSGQSGTQQITSAALNFDFPIIFWYSFATTAATGNGTTATLTFATSTNCPAVGSTIIVSGVTPAGYNGTYTVTASTNTTVSYLNATTAAQTVAGTIVNGGSTTYTLQDALSVGTSTSRTITLNTGTLNLNNFTLTNFGLWASNNANTRAIAFGTGNYTNTYTVATATVWGMQTATGFTYTGTPTVNVTGNSTGAFTRTLAHGSTAGATEANSITFNISAGSDTIAMGGGFLNVNLTGFSGTFGLSARSIYGNLTLPSGLTITAGTSTTTFASTSATTRTITTNSNTLDFPVTFNGVGGSWQLQDALTVGTTRTLSLNNGSFNSGNQSITTGLFNFSNGNTKSLLLGTSTVTITGGTSTSGFIGSNSGTTYDVVNSTIVFSNTGTFAGGSGGVGGTQFGTVTMSAASGTLYLGTTATTTARCTTLNNTVSPCTITNSCTTAFTVTNFNVNGTAGNLVVLNSNTAGTARTITKASGTTDVDYLNIQDSTATSGTWTAHSSTNSGNNTGWIFTVDVIGSKITSTGILSIAGYFDEVSYSPASSGAYTYNNGVSTSVNKLNYSQDFTNWSKNASPNDYTVSADSTAAPDGSTTADLIIKSTGVGSSSVCYKLFTGAISTAYCGSIYLKAGGYSKVQVVFGNTAFNSTNYGGNFDLVAGTNNAILNGSTVTITSVGNGWYRITVTATSDADGGNYVFAITLLDASYSANFAGNGTSGIYLWGAQVELGSAATAYVATGATTSININNFAQRTIASGIEYVSGSFDEVSYNPNGGTGQIGYNGTDTTTNKLKYTQDFSNALWVKQQLSTSIDVTIDATTAPDGSLTADKLAQSSTGGTYYSVYQNFTPTASTNYTYSMFVKNAGGTGSINLTIYDTVNAQYAQFNISTGVAGATTINGATFTLNSRSITSYGNGWYRCAFSFSSSLSGNFQFKVDFGVSGVGTGVYLWGAQLEQALTPTAYVGMLGTGVNINNFARRVVSTGVEYVSGEFDEYTGNLV